MLEASTNDRVAIDGPTHDCMGANSAAANANCVSGLPRRSRLLASASYLDESDAARNDLASCRIYQVKSLPGSHLFASEFVETIATDPDTTITSNVVWGLTSKTLSSDVPPQDRAMYISQSSNAGVTWTSSGLRIDSRYFDAGIGEGLRNGLGVVPGGHEFVITTQRGLFQVFPQSNASATVVKSIPGPRVPHVRPKISIPKEEGDPCTRGELC